MKSEFRGSIGGIRAVEDCIRATRKYTEGVMTMGRKHPEQPVQGEDFPSRVFSKYYEVYPDIELGWDMSVDDLMDWLWRDTPCVDVNFWYDYRENRGKVTVKGGPGAVSKLVSTIPGFDTALGGLSPVLGDNGKAVEQNHKVATERADEPAR